MEQYIQWILANWEGIIAVLTGIVTAASAIAAMTDTPTDDTWVGKAKDK